MLRFISISDAYKEDWNRVVLDSDDAWFFHLYDWLSVTERSWDLESKSFLLEYEGKIVGIFPLQLNRKSKSLTSTYMGLGGAVVLNGVQEGVRKKALKAMYAQARSIARENQCPSLEVRLSPLSEASLINHWQVNPLIHYSFEDTSTHTWMLNLTSSEEELLGHYSDDARRSIKKAIDQGYTVSKVNALTDIDKFYEIHCENRQRTGAEIHPKDFFYDTFNAFVRDGSVVIWQAKDAHGHSVAFEVIATFKNKALYWMGCCSTSALDSGVNYLLQHHSIIEAKRQGARWFENGEAFPNVEEGKLRGLTVFKGKFGGDLRRFFKGQVRFYDPNNERNIFKDWLRATIRLLEPLVGKTGIRRLEHSLSKLYRVMVRFNKSVFRVRFIRPSWGLSEFWSGMIYSDRGNDGAIETLISRIKSLFRMEGKRGVFPTSSGRTALELALQVIRKKDPQRNEVVVTTYGCRGVFDPIVRSEMIPVFADIGYDLNLSYGCVEKLLQQHDKIAAIIVPHLCGSVADIDAIASLAKAKGIVVIEDVCQSLGASKDGYFLGARQDMAIFSFGLGKNLTATSGGLLISNIWNEELRQEYQTMKCEETSIVRRRFWKIILKHFLRCPVDLHREILSGYGYLKMHPLDAHILIIQLSKMKPIIEKQRRNAQQLIEVLRKTGLRFHLQESQNHIYSKLSVIFENENDCRRLEKCLHDRGVETEEMYTPLHLRDFSKGFETDRPLSNAQQTYRSVFNIPVRPNLTVFQIRRIQKAIECVNSERD